MPKDTVQRTGKESSSLTFLLMGFYFSLLQVGLFFITQMNVSATQVGYYLVVFAWLAGIILTLKFNWPKSLERGLVISSFAYYGYLILSSYLIPRVYLWPVFFSLAVLTALPAGLFFRKFSNTVSSYSLFLHENNGFIFGLLTGTFGFVRWGIHFLQLSPILALTAVFLSLKEKGRPAWGILLVSALFCLVMREMATGMTLLGLALLFVLIRFIHSLPKAEILLRPIAVPLEKEQYSAKAVKAILFFAGFNSILLQFFLTREFSVILAASEVTVLIVAAAFFVSYSVGYGLSQFLSRGFLAPVALFTFLIHMVLLIFSRPLAGYLIQAGYGTSVLWGLLFITAFFAAPLYSILLPKLIELRGRNSLPASYSWDLAGAMAGILMMMVLTAVAPNMLWPIYFLFFTILTLLLLGEHPWTFPVALIQCFFTLLLTLYQSPILRYSLEDYYATRGYQNPKLLFTGNSFYHNVDVIETYRDQERTKALSRASFLNGVLYFNINYPDSEETAFGETGLSEFTYFLAELPAAYLSKTLNRKLKILIMGAGSMISLRRVEKYSGKTTMVEIDSLIVKSSKRVWKDLNRYDEVQNYELVIDDAKSFLRKTTEHFDLIINDVSAPYYIGTTLMHSRELYELVKSRLTPEGMFAESTQSRPFPDKPESSSMKILGGVASVFQYQRVVEQRGPRRSQRGFVYAAENLDISSEILASQMVEDGMQPNVLLFNQVRERYRLNRVIPYSRFNMEILLEGNLKRTKSRLRGGSHPDDRSILIRLGDLLKK